MFEIKRASNRPDRFSKRNKRYGEMINNVTIHHIIALGSDEYSLVIIITLTRLRGAFGTRSFTFPQEITRPLKSSHGLRRVGTECEGWASKMILIKLVKLS